MKDLFSLTDFGPLLENWRARNKKECQLCKSNIGVDSFNDHMTVAHPGKLYYEAKIPMEFYKCLLCDRRMLWVHKSIHQHMKKKHNRTIVSYTMDNVTKITEQVTLANIGKVKKRNQSKKRLGKRKRRPDGLMGVNICAAFVTKYSSKSRTLAIIW